VTTAAMSIDETKQFVPLNIAVLTISDTRSLADDKSGTTLADRLVAAGHHLAAREIITDDVDATVRPLCVTGPDVTGALALKKFSKSASAL